MSFLARGFRPLGFTSVVCNDELQSHLLIISLDLLRRGTDWVWTNRRAPCHRNSLFCPIVQTNPSRRSLCFPVHPRTPFCFSPYGVRLNSTAELGSWVDYCYQIMKRGVLVYDYANNHFQGYGPATIEQFRKLWDGKGLPEIGKPTRQRSEPSLFPLH